MTQDKLKGAIEVLYAELEEQERQVQETKRAINMLVRRLGEAEPYPNVDSQTVGSVNRLRPDAFYGKAFATAAQEYLQMRRQASTADEITEGLRAGGFDFKSMSWKPDDLKRMVPLSLSKNTSYFHRLPNGTFGLLEWYPEVAKRLAGKKAASTDAAPASSPAASSTPAAEEEEEGEQEG